MPRRIVASLCVDGAVPSPCSALPRGAGPARAGAWQVPLRTDPNGASSPRLGASGQEIFVILTKPRNFLGKRVVTSTASFYQNPGAIPANASPRKQSPAGKCLVRTGRRGSVCGGLPILGSAGALRAHCGRRVEPLPLPRCSGPVRSSGGGVARRGSAWCGVNGRVVPGWMVPAPAAPCPAPAGPGPLRRSGNKLLPGRGGA